MNIVEKISKFWNKLKYWQKGGIIGFILGWLPFLYSFLPIKLKQWVLFFSPNLYVPSFNFDPMLFILFIVGLILGFVGGFIIDRINRRYPSFSKLSNAKRFGAISFLVLTLLLSVIPLFFLYNVIRLVISPLREAGATILVILLNLFLALVSLFSMLILILLFSLPVSLLGLPLDLFKKYKIRRLSIYLLYILILLLSSFILYSLFIQGLGTIIGILIPS